VSGTGKIIASFPISPSAYPGTRLTQLSNLWEFFKFDKFHVRWVPAVPTTLACQFVFYVDLDPSDDPTVILDEASLIRQAVAQTGAQQWNFHVPKRIPMAMRSDRQFYFTGLDKQNVRFSQQGKGYLIQITNPINFNGENLVDDIQAGSLFIDWTVAFNTPQINPEPIVAASTLPFAPSPAVRVPLSPSPADGVTEYTLSGLTPGNAYVYSFAFTAGAIPDVKFVDLAISTPVQGLRFDLNAVSCFINPSTNGYQVFVAATDNYLIRVDALALAAVPVELILTDLNSLSARVDTSYVCQSHHVLLDAC
jgi:hypothetical protein